jgi:hypothetical protein
MVGELRKRVGWAGRSRRHMRRVPWHRDASKVSQRLTNKRASACVRAWVGVSLLEVLEEVASLLVRLPHIPYMARGWFETLKQSL